MAADQAPQETVAIAFLVESSLDVALEWRRKIAEYSTALVKRLSDCHPNSKLKVAFVSYGPSDNIPSPILCKRFFVDHQSFSKEMAEDYSRLGIGMTNSGGVRGMAALEGFVAALELFDIFQSYLPPQAPNNTPTAIFHLVHVAASSPDSCLHPLWNDSATLDNVEWDTLPSEIKKRNIQFTSINLRPGLKRFSELSAAVVNGGSPPWFTVYSPHSILLAAFPAPPQTAKGTPIKRAIEPPAERASEPKRPRLQPNIESPKPAPKTVAPQTQPNPTSLPHVPIPPRPVVQPVPAQSLPNMTNPLAKVPTQLSPQQITERMRIAEAYIQAMQQKITAAQAAGNTQMVEGLLKEYQIKKVAHARITQAYQRLIAGHLQSQNKPQGSMLQNPGYAHSLSTGNLPSTSAAISLPQDAIPNPPQIHQVRSLNDANLPMNAPSNPATATMNPGGNPNITLQIQKMIEQQQQAQRNRAQNPVVGGQALASNVLHNIAPSTNLPNRLNPVPGPSQIPQQPDQQTSSKGKPVWRGMLNWSGTSAAGKKDMQTFVIATHMNETKCHQETWPVEMALAPIRDPSGPEELSDWVRRHQNQAAICRLDAPLNVQNARANATHFQSLINLLLEKKIFATAAWTTPTGGQTKNALIFPMGGHLFGAFFALTGLPANLPTIIDPRLRAFQQMQSIQNMPQEVQVALLQKLTQSKTALAQQQASRSQDANNPTPFPQNLHLGHNMAQTHMMNAHAPNGAMMNVNGPQPSFTPSLPRVGINNNNNPVPSNLSLAMLQSFVQRNDGGTNLNPQG